MIQWRIKQGDNESVIETGNITVLKSARWEWFQLVRSIDDYFEGKNSEVEILEDTIPLYKKDWECLFIPYDAELDLAKLTSKSPLKPLVEELIDKIAVSPVFHEITELWGELNDELQIISNDLNKYGLKAGFIPLSEEELKKLLLFQSIKAQMAPIDFKLMLLNLFVNRPVDKKRLVILELPELYCDQKSLSTIQSIISRNANRGIKFIVVTEMQIEGNKNYIIENNIINKASFEIIKRKVINSLPFICDDQKFFEAEKAIINAVDISSDLSRLVDKTIEDDEALAVIIVLLLKELGIQITLDTSRFSHNIQVYFEVS
ncbi:MAG: hypothetical protein ACO1OT_10475 [Heyndrickxia sp.]